MSEILNWQFFKSNISFMHNMLIDNLNANINDLVTTQAILFSFYVVAYFMFMSFIISGKPTLIFRFKASILSMIIVGLPAIYFGLNDIVFFLGILFFAGSIACYVLKDTFYQYETIQAFLELGKYIKDNDAKK